MSGLDQNSNKIEVWYDGWCPLCQGIRQRLERWDWMKRLTFHSIREVNEKSPAPAPVAELEARMHVRRLADGRVYSGIDAVTAICGVVPLLMPWWLPLKLATWLGIGDKVYDWIAARRKIVPAGACQDDACPLNSHRPKG
ncbi:thiol-disulfide oxidoreductase DCC family protein [Paenibacillus sp. 481]|uniref:thiol-disulfide oxidoreductase DCC family protein n=1 Tax=Paenibacillus sp. 481 TaxID=2835869 RepID=UPI001E38B4FE|nr:DUF393 domain-containing protein [Paenibacillus sp. 481]UHA73254.1 DUF393 domain-containing protein [Paenibacillus sp. 481]